MDRNSFSPVFPLEWVHWVVSSPSPRPPLLETLRLALLGRILGSTYGKFEYFCKKKKYAENEGYMEV